MYIQTGYDLDVNYEVIFRATKNFRPTQRMDV